MEKTASSSVKKRALSTSQMALIGVMTAVTCILGPFSIPLPFSPALEFPLIPDDKKIYAAIKEML